MAKYYCEYCKSYLTHDSLSVRKSHLIGRNHLRKYCDYYEEKAKDLGIWDSNDLPYEITETDLYSNIPGRPMPEFTPLETFPPPPSLPNLPNPPPAIYHYNTTDEKELIASVMREYQHRNTVK